MELTVFFKSIIDQDTAPIVICDLEHTVVYMNKVACDRYAKYGGAQLVGKNLLCCHNEVSKEKIINVLDWFKDSRLNNIVHTYYNPKENKDVYMVALRSDDGTLVGYYEKHEYRNIETAELYSMK